jgi:formylglycine-generating enzyme
MNKLLIFTLLALSYQSASATSLLETFGSDANQFSMEFVAIGNPGNAADTTGSPNPAGSVAYTYNIGKYEVSRGQIDKANSAGSLGITMYDMSSFGGNGVLKPATGISYYEAATYVNWLNTSTGNTAAYKFDGSGTFQLWSPTDAGYDANNMFRNSQAKYVIASRNEWYKGAYGNADGSWSNYPNGSDSAPMPVASGTDANTAVYNQISGPADINNAGGLSAYGTMAQGGNVWEWNETALDESNEIVSETRVLSGGMWSANGNDLNASVLYYGSPSDEESGYGTGFRIASVPEPSSLSLLVLGGLVAALRRRKK